MPRKWTPEQKAAQAEKIRAWRPWEKSTGPQSARGKKNAKMNAFTNGLYAAEYDILRHGLRQQREFVRGVALWHAAQKKLAALRNRTIIKSLKNNAPPPPLGVSPGTEY